MSVRRSIVKIFGVATALAMTLVAVGVLSTATASAQPYPAPNIGTVINTDGSVTIDLTGSSCVGNVIVTTSTGTVLFDGPIPAGGVFTVGPISAATPLRRAHQSITITCTTAGGQPLTQIVTLPHVPSDLIIAAIDPVPCNGPISGSVSGGTPPYTVTVDAGTVFSVALAAPGTYSIPITAATVPAGPVTYTYSATDTAGNTASGSLSAVIEYGCVGPTPVTSVLGITITNPAIGAGGTVTGTTTGEAPRLAITGSSSSFLALLALGMIGVGSMVLIGTRRTGAQQ